MYNANPRKSLNKGQILALYKAAKTKTFSKYWSPVIQIVGNMRVVFGINPSGEKYFCVQ